MYTNIDYRSAIKEQKSISRQLFCLGRSLISQNAKRQTVVVLSSCEAEYIALNKESKEAIWLKKILKELGLMIYSLSLPHQFTKIIRELLLLLKIQSFTSQTKNIKIVYHQIKDIIGQKFISYEYISTREQADDGLIKALTLKAFHDFQKIVAMAKRDVK